VLIDFEVAPDPVSTEPVPESAGLPSKSVLVTMEDSWSWPAAVVHWQLILKYSSL